MPGMPGMLVFFGCILALPVAGDSPLDWDIRFHCVTQDVSDMDFCRGPQNGNCPNTSKCFMRKDFSTQHVWGGCCCDRNSTPVEMIENDHHDWSCWVHFVTDVRETKGKDPYCDVLCCPRPFQALACHGQRPQCCDGQVSECGISLSGDPCCAPRQVLSEDVSGKGARSRKVSTHETMHALVCSLQQRHGQAPWNRAARKKGHICSLAPWSTDVLVWWSLSTALWRYVAWLQFQPS
ncbi:unnamed protein product [Effrenium voratum]|nr:unnamed protein product [Effrenium voratum]